jgi:hypothetical protein
LERYFLAAMNELGYGRFESVRIEHRALVLDPWPKTVRSLTFGAESPPPQKGFQDEFELKPAVVKFFQYVRAIGEGEILCLTIARGLPASMATTHLPDNSRGRHGS